MTRRQAPGSRSVRPSRLIRPSRAAAGLLALLASAALQVVALADGSAMPVSPAREGLKPLGEVAAWTSPPVDVPKLLREDAARDGKLGTPLRIGYRMATDLSPATAGTWEDLKDGGRIWRLSVRSADALWIVLGFDEFRIEDGATLFVYDPALKSPRSYTAADVRPHGELWTPPIEGDQLVVELLWPAKLAGVAPRLHLGGVSHGYLPFGTIGRAKAEQDGIGDSGSCNIDVACPLGVNWQNEKRGAVILLSGGEGFCSGSLINTTANDCRPYVLTAAHCTAGTSTVFGFNFERSACGSGDPPPPDTYTVSGATVLANYASSDFTLLQMNGSPPEEWNAYYNGWNRGTTPPNESTVIHHPRGDLKKIAYDDDPATDGSNWGPNHWRIGEYEQGTTEPGSSGSPLFDQNHHIIGQLHGGTASCTSLTYDEYGKVDASWIGGGTSASRLSDWLDPNVTGQLTMDGVAGIVCAFNPTGSISLDSATYACTDTMLITLRDDNLRGYETQAVTITSNTETAPETVVLTATEPGSGFFTGTFPVAPGAPVHGDGHLSVSPGDVVTVLYIDEDDGNGGVNVPVTTTALIDCVGPVISAVASQNVTGNSAQVVWTTDELATGSVTYDTAFPPGAGSASSAVVTVNHLVNLAGLTPVYDLLLLGQLDRPGRQPDDRHERRGLLHVPDRHEHQPDLPVRRPGRADPRQQHHGRDRHDQRPLLRLRHEDRRDREHHPQLRRRHRADADRARRAHGAALDQARLVRRQLRRHGLRRRRGDRDLRGDRAVHRPVPAGEPARRPQRHRLLRRLEAAGRGQREQRHRDDRRLVADAALPAGALRGTGQPGRGHLQLLRQFHDHRQGHECRRADVDGHRDLRDRHDRRERDSHAARRPDATPGSRGRSPSPPPRLPRATASSRS